MTFSELYSLMSVYIYYFQIFTEDKTKMSRTERHL